VLRHARWSAAVCAQIDVLEGIGFSTRIDARVPVGDYVAVQFKHATTSENVTTTEKVVMERHQSEWKIVGYFVGRHTEYGRGG
jgi:hypothetical protein